MSATNAYISRRNWMLEDGVAVTCSEADADDMPLENLFDGDANVWARVLDTGFTLSIDLGAARAIRCVLLVRTNFTSSLTRRIKIGSTPGGNDIYDDGSAVSAGVVDSVGQVAIDLGATYTGRYVEIALSDAGLTGGYADAAELWIGAADIMPEMGITYGGQFGGQFRDDVRRAEDGSATAWQRRMLRSWNVSFPVLSASEANALFDLDAVMTGASPVVLMPFAFSDLGRRAVMGLLSEATPVEAAFFDRESKVLRITEV